jgi:hypothetical protein
VKTLLDNGIKLEQVRKAFGYVREQLGEDPTAARLMITGDSVVLVRDDNDLVDVVNRYQGQGVLNLLALDGVKQEVDNAIDLFPGDSSDAGGTSSEPGTLRRAASGPR